MHVRDEPASPNQFRAAAARRGALGEAKVDDEAARTTRTRVNDAQPDPALTAGGSSSGRDATLRQ